MWKWELRGEVRILYSHCRLSSSKTLSWEKWSRPRSPGTSTRHCSRLCASVENYTAHTFVPQLNMTQIEMLSFRFLSFFNVFSVLKILFVCPCVYNISFVVSIEDRKPGEGIAPTRQPLQATDAWSHLSMRFFFLIFRNRLGPHCTLENKRRCRKRVHSYFHVRRKTLLQYFWH